MRSFFFFFEGFRGRQREKEKLEARTFHSVSTNSKQQGSGLPPSDAPVWILGVCYKNGEGGGRATEAAAAAAEVAEGEDGESNERVVVAAAAANGDRGAFSPSASAPTTKSGLDPEVAAAAASDWASIPWMTYRRGFPPIREEQSASFLTSDVGWGCTLRSGQMLLAAAAQRVAVGRHWRRETSRAAARARLPPALEEALALFADEPGAPLSVHSLLAAPGVAARARAERRRRKREAEGSKEADRSESGSEASSSSSSSSSSSGCDDGDDDGESSSPSRFRGLTPGEWLGPSTFCRAAEAALTDAWPSSANGGRGAPPPMRVLVVGGGGGGAPALDPAAAARTPASRSPPSPSPSSAVPLLVLVPVQAGLGRTINPVYAAQVAAALRWPQSVGVVGGRRGASLFFAGTASLRSGASGPGRSRSSSAAAANERSLSDAESEDLGLLYLDPHVPRPAVLLPQRDRRGRHRAPSRTRGVGAARAPPPLAPVPPSAPAAIDPSDFFSDDPPARPLPLCSADPSLALGFLCSDDCDYGDLVARAARLAAKNPRWPLVSVAKAPSSRGGERKQEEGGRAQQASRGGRGDRRSQQQDREDAGDWELL